MKSWSMRLLLLAGSFLLSQVTQAQEIFPGSWLGTWKGELSWYKNGELPPQKVNMELRIKAGDTVGVYSWHLIYGPAAQDSRPYLLIAKDSTRTHIHSSYMLGVFIIIVIVLSYQLFLSHVDCDGNKKKGITRLINQEN